MSTAISAALVITGIGAILLAGLRWLRVAQRVHYLAGSTSRFAARWWTVTPLNLIGLVLALMGTMASPFGAMAAAIPIAVVALGPRGLSPRGRTSQLAWTRRLKSLAAAAAGLELVVVLAVCLVSLPLAMAVGTLVVPVIIDLAALLLAPLEERASRRFVDQAAARLGRVAPRIIGITGSYGKTSVKNHLVGLVAGNLATVASPRSFNNRAGLARAINEHLAEGTEVFIAEMGTYGPGEIADLCTWCPPSIAVMTAIGPVHLERFGSLDVTVAAKAEIAVGAEVVVINVDDDRLAVLADQLTREGKRVLRAGSARRDADIVVTEGDAAWGIEVSGVLVGASPVLPGLQPTNVACAVAAAIALGLDPATVASRVEHLSTIENRLGVARVPSGVTVVDDTFNSNPAGAEAALRVLAGLGVTGRRVVVTPGMVELGGRQRHENEHFGHRAAEIADVVLVVGRTNRRSLIAGVSAADAELRLVATREEAVEWVRSNLGADDAVLYENDLPDNYP